MKGMYLTAALIIILPLAAQAARVSNALPGRPDPVVLNQCIALPGSFRALRCPERTWNNVWSVRARKHALLGAKVGVKSPACAREKNGLVRWYRIDNTPHYKCKPGVVVSPG